MSEGVLSLSDATSESNDSRDLSDSNDLSDSDNLISLSSSDTDEYDDPSPLVVEIDLSTFKKDIEKEYESLKKNSPRKIEATISEECCHKNRYMNIVPFEDTRVRLLDSSFDYINANYIHEDNANHVFRDHKYIATQGPLESTIDDFWQMIWQNDTEIIVMVCRLYEKYRMKCYKYWPHNKQNASFKRDLNVEHKNTLKVGDGIVVRTFILSREGVHRTVNQIQLNGWPDFGVPDITTFTNFIDLYRTIQLSTKLDGYVVVHCSAGVGRTGTFLAIDIGLNQILHTKKACNIHNIVNYIRTKRGNMIQTTQQYEFVYQVLMYYSIVNNIESCCDDQRECLFGSIVSKSKLQ